MELINHKSCDLIHDTKLTGLNMCYETGDIKNMKAVDIC